MGGAAEAIEWNGIFFNFLMERERTALLRGWMEEVESVGIEKGSGGEKKEGRMFLFFDA